MSRGQSLVELALTLPAVLVLALGTGAAVRLADARAGLDGATAEAAAVAARQSDPVTGASVAAGRFQALTAGYPLQSPSLAITGGDWSRGTVLVATGGATVDLGFAPVPGIPTRLVLASTAQARIEPWRSR